MSTKMDDSFLFAPEFDPRPAMPDSSEQSSGTQTQPSVNMPLPSNNATAFAFKQVHPHPCDLWERVGPSQQLILPPNTSHRLGSGGAKFGRFLVSSDRAGINRTERKD